MESIVLKEILNSKGLLKGEKVTEVNPISGGCIHQAWRLKLETGRLLFAKTCPKENFLMLKFEADCLTALNNKANQDFLKIPTPISWEEFPTIGILIMEWMDIKEGNQSKLGKGLALLHQKSSKFNQFGWGENGFIGYNPQIRGWEASWGKCFVNLRLAPQIQLARKRGLGLSLEGFSDRLIKYLDIHEPKSCLVHGDLWKGNVGINDNGQGVIFDPAVWMADREVDIAMTKLFGGFSNDFYNAYNKTWPLPENHENRIDIYNLYHLINHANLFGGGYTRQALSSLNKIRTFVEKY